MWRFVAVGTTVIWLAVVAAACGFAYTCTPNSADYERCEQQRQQYEDAQRKAQEDAQEAIRKAAKDAADQAIEEGKKQAQNAFEQAINDAKQKIGDALGSLVAQIPFFGSGVTSTQPPQTPSLVLFSDLPVTLGKDDYVLWYGNTEWSFCDRYLHPRDPNDPTTRPFYEALRGMHDGLDFGLPMDPKKPFVGREIFSASHTLGEVVYIGTSYGAEPTALMIKHGDYVVLYGHLSAVLVQVGQKNIGFGDKIALSGIGNGVSHLHLEVLPASDWQGKRTRINPVPLFAPSLQAQLVEKAAKSPVWNRFHPLPNGKWGTPQDQPNIEPTSAPQYLVPSGNTESEKAICKQY